MKKIKNHSQRVSGRVDEWNRLSDQIIKTSDRELRATVVGAKCLFQTQVLPHLGFKKHGISFAHFIFLSPRYSVSVRVGINTPLPDRIRQFKPILSQFPNLKSNSTQLGRGKKRRRREALILSSPPLSPLFLCIFWSPSLSPFTLLPTYSSSRTLKTTKGT